MGKSSKKGVFGAATACTLCDNGLPLEQSANTTGVWFEFHKLNWISEIDGLPLVQSGNKWSQIN